MHSSEMRHHAAQCRALASEDQAGRDLLLELAVTWERLSKLRELREKESSEENVQRRPPLEVQPEAPPFRAIGIQAVAATAPLQRRAPPRKVAKELPPLLRKSKFVD